MHPILSLMRLSVGLLAAATTRARRCGEKRQASRMLSRADSQGSRLKS